MEILSEFVKWRKKMKTINGKMIRKMFAAAHQLQKADEYLKFIEDSLWCGDLLEKNDKEDRQIYEEIKTIRARVLCAIDLTYSKLLKEDAPEKE